MWQRTAQEFVEQPRDDSTAREDFVESRRFVRMTLNSGTLACRFNASV
jgi:hypothetical protein